MKTGLAPQLSLLLCVITLCLSGTASPLETQKEMSAGWELFTRVWTPAQGLGPSLNARSCAGCHDTPEVGGSGIDRRAFVLLDPRVTDPTGGHVFRRLRVGPYGEMTERSEPLARIPRKAPSLIGSGLIEQIPNTTIAEIADPDDVNHDGISGRLPDGRFGWKGRFPNLHLAVAAGFVNELGISNPVFPSDAVPSNRSGSTVELRAAELTAVEQFVRGLAPSTQHQEPVSTQPGCLLFERVGCASCHAPSFRLPAGLVIRPYSDLLLHDMGPALADGITDGNATGAEFKTPPLWNLDRTGPPYLHDGRATTLNDAIADHGGEGNDAANAYHAMSLDERALLLVFLRSL